MNCSVLSGEQVERIHEASLEILQRIGVVVPHEEMLGRFADAGADVDHDSQLVKIPAELVDRCVAQAGKTFAIYGRDESKSAGFGVGRAEL